MRRLLWFKFEDQHGREWSVWLSSRFWCPYLVGAAGATVFEDRDIYIDVVQPVPEQDETVAHEAKHSLLLPKGRRSRYVPARSPEETMIRKLSPAYYALATKMGLKWPPRPAGYASLARSARRRHNEAEEAE